MGDKAKQPASGKRGVSAKKPSGQAKPPAPPKSRGSRAPVSIDSAAAAAEPLKQKGVQLKPGEEVHCSFCGGSNFEREVLIAAQLNPVYICQECVEVCRDIIGIHRMGP